MNNFEIYNDIAKRTNGDIYIGVVGPVRTGKSTFISKFMQTSILDNIEGKYDRERAIDEMPQSGAGKTIMTMQPKFVPNEAIEVKFGGNVSAKIRLVDCVGYAINGASGFEENGMPRMVKTPWSEEEMPFETAAEIGTRKVIAEHSTIAVLVTTDGTITDINRENYVPAEERVVNELKENDKPFVVLLNSVNPMGDEAQNLAKKLKDKYGVPVLCYNVSTMNENDINQIIKEILLEFPVNKISFDLPKWLTALPSDDDFITTIMECIKEHTQNVVKMSDALNIGNIFEGNEDLKEIEIKNVDMSCGNIEYNIPVNEKLYYKALSKACGIEIEDDYSLMSHLKELVYAKNEYDKIKQALDTVKQTGYGIVSPTLEDLELAEPEIVTKGGNSILKLRAKAPSLHIMRVDVESEICPTVGGGEQSGAIVNYMINEFETNKQELWNKNMFGKPMDELVKESIDSKVAGLPEEVQFKMRKTLTKIVNERKGGIICILL